MRSPNLLMTRFLGQNDNLPVEYCGFIIHPRIDSYGRIRISVVLPADSEVLEPSTKRGWRRLLSDWLKRAKVYNDKTGANEEYRAHLRSAWPTVFVTWVKQHELNYEDDEGSYLDLSNKLNQSIFDGLSRAFQLRHDDDALWRSIGQEEVSCARGTMRFFNVPTGEHDQWIEQVSELYKQGHESFDMVEPGKRRRRKPSVNGPITRDAVIAKVRALKRKHPFLFSKL